MLLVICVPSTSLARNVIVEWGGHAHGDYYINRVGDNDVGVVITANSEPERAWKFEAYEDGSPEGPPGYIDYIKIANGVTVGGIHLSVIGDPSAGHTRGAAAVKALNLRSNSDGTNVLDALDVVLDVGELGPLWADYASTLTIGGDVLNNIDITHNITGPWTISGTLWQELSATIVGAPMSIANVEGTVNINTVYGSISIGTLAGTFTSETASATISIDTQTAGSSVHATYLQNDLTVRVGAGGATIYAMYMYDPEDTITVLEDYGGTITLGST